MFWKKRKTNQTEPKVESENLAVPEVHFGDVKCEDDKGQAETGTIGEKEQITYDNVAIPEVHIRKKKK